jgi:hypothetical protein
MRRRQAWLADMKKTQKNRAAYPDMRGGGDEPTPLEKQ